MNDLITIKGLRMDTRVGVPPEERAKPQSVTVDIEFESDTPFSHCDDDIDQTVDYYEVAQSLINVAGTGERNLIETLADDLAREVLQFDRVHTVRVEVKKYILPNTDYVSAKVERTNLVYL